jgi:hypothetical protein
MSPVGRISVSGNETEKGYREKGKAKLTGR